MARGFGLDVGAHLALRDRGDELVRAAQVVGREACRREDDLDT